MWQNRHGLRNVTRPGTSHPEATRRKAPLIVLLFLAVSAILVSLYSSVETHRLLTRSFAEPSLCSISALIDCRAALVSRHAFVGGIPLSWVAALYYLWMAVSAALTLAQPQRARGVWRAVLVSSLATLVVTAYLVWVMAARLRVLCPTCVLLHAVNLSVCLLALGVAGYSPIRLIRSGTWGVQRGLLRLAGGLAPGRAWLYLGGLCIVILLGAFALRSTYGASPSTHEVRVLEALADFYRRPVEDIAVPEGAPVRGDESAPVRVVVFSDFRCVYCRKIPGVLEPYGDRVRMTFLHYPIHNGVNPYVNHRGHPQSKVAARGAVLAHEDGMFWAFHDTVFHNQSEVDAAFVRDLLSQFGIPSDRIGEVLDEGSADARLLADVEAGHELGIRGTPTIFINGRRMKGFQAQVLDAIVRQELGARSPTSPGDPNVPTPSAASQAPAQRIDDRG